MRFLAKTFSLNFNESIIFVFLINYVQTFVGLDVYQLQLRQAKAVTHPGTTPG
jgi:hypothetical protein